MVTTEFEVRRPVLVGDTADVYHHRALMILRNESVNPEISKVSDQEIDKILLVMRIILLLVNTYFFLTVTLKCCLGRSTNSFRLYERQIQCVVIITGDP